MKRVALAALFLLAGCQGDDPGYDAAAKAKARAVAPTIASYGEAVRHTAQWSPDIVVTLERPPGS